MIRIVVASDSALKIGAVERAIARVCVDADVIGLRVASGVPAQPYGREETLAGASNRARAAQDLCQPDDFVVGIENGLVPHGDAVLDVAYVVVYTPSGRRIERKSIGIRVPPELVEAVLACGQARTAGDLEAERSGSDPVDPHRVWSQGVTDRESILVNVLTQALAAAVIREEGES